MRSEWGRRREEGLRRLRERRRERESELQELRRQVQAVIDLGVTPEQLVEEGILEDGEVERVLHLDTDAIDRRRHE
jgi:hypothetical protein